MNGADPNASLVSARLRSRKQCAHDPDMLEAEPCSLQLMPEPPLPLSVAVSALTVASAKKYLTERREAAEGETEPPEKKD